MQSHVAVARFLGQWDHHASLLSDRQRAPLIWMVLAHDIVVLLGYHFCRPFLIN